MAALVINLNNLLVLKYWSFVTVVSGLVFYWFIFKINLPGMFWGMNEWHTKFHNKRSFIKRIKSRKIETGKIYEASNIRRVKKKIKYKAI